MPSWKMLNTWESDLPGLTDEQLRERHELAVRYEQSSMKKGLGRNPKAARDWRRVEIESSWRWSAGLPSPHDWLNYSGAY